MTGHEMPTEHSAERVGDVARRSGARRAAVEAALIEGQRRFLGFLISRLGNAADARDVMQDFAVRALARSDDLRDNASVRGWLSRILATSIADHHRRSSRKLRREAPADPAVQNAVAAPAEDAEADAALCACMHILLRALPPGQADLIRRVDLGDVPRPAVARDLGISEGTLAVRLHRARKALRELLIAQCVTCPEHGFLDCGCDRARTRLHKAVDQVGLDSV